MIVEYDSRWCGAMWAKNALQKSGFALAYAQYGRGLIIYDGFDYDQVGIPIYAKLVDAASWRNRSIRTTCRAAQPLGDFIITADTG